MGLFEFLMILLSVVIGLALSELLTGLAQLLRNRDTVKFYWMHSLFQLGVFMALLQQWWESWHWADVETLELGTVLLQLFQPVVLFLIAHLLTPQEAAGISLKKYYFKQAPVLWALVALGTIVGTIVAPLIRGDAIFELGNVSGTPLILISGTLIVSKREIVHAILGPIVMVLVILDTWLIMPAISAG